MTTRLFLILSTLTLSVFVAAAVVAQGIAGTSGAKAPSKATITIHHQTRGCHTWTLNSGKSHATLSTRLARGGSITIVNVDVMPHRIFLKSGPAVHFQSNPALRHMGASVKVTFSKAGTYQFKTKAGEDYMPGVKTVGEDNILRFTVTVA
jgi:plastocyanin